MNGTQHNKTIDLSKSSRCRFGMAPKRKAKGAAAEATFNVQEKSFIVLEMHTEKSNSGHNQPTVLGLFRDQKKPRNGSIELLRSIS